MLRVWYRHGLPHLQLQPLQGDLPRHFSQGGIGIVEMLFRCNILALVGGESAPVPEKGHDLGRPSEPVHRGAFLPGEVRGEAPPDRVVVVLENKIYVYNFADLKLVDHVETIKTRGAGRPLPEQRQHGPRVPRTHPRPRPRRAVRLATLHPSSPRTRQTSRRWRQPRGQRLATASERDAIRIFDTQTGQLQQEPGRARTRRTV